MVTQKKFSASLSFFPNHQIRRIKPTFVKTFHFNNFTKLVSQVVTARSNKEGQNCRHICQNITTSYNPLRPCLMPNKVTSQIQLDSTDLDLHKKCSTFSQNISNGLEGLVGINQAYQSFSECLVMVIMEYFHEINREFSRSYFLTLNSHQHLVAMDPIQNVFSDRIS